MEKCCSSVVMLVTVMAVTLACMAVPKTDAKPDPRADQHEVGSVWPDNVMIMSSNIERSEGETVGESKGDVSVFTPEVTVTSSDDGVIMESITASVESNPTINSNIQTDEIISPIENINIDTVKAEEEITAPISVPTADESIPTVENVPVISDETIPVVKINEDVVNNVNSTLDKILDVNCVFNMAIPNRNIPSITYSTNCDFCNHEMYTLTCIPDAFTCASLCAGDRRCTHFTYISNLIGGTCRLKNAPGSGGSWASAVKAPSPYVCGYIGKRAFHNILLGLCLSLDINVDVE